LKDVLEELDQKDDSNWTAEGLPTLDAVSKKVGRTVTRKELNEISPGFVRKMDAKGEKFERKVAAAPAAVNATPVDEPVPPTHQDSGETDRDAEAGSTEQIIAGHDAGIAEAQKLVDDANATLAERVAARDRAVLANETALAGKPKHVQQMESTLAFIEAGKRDRGATSARLAPVDEAMARVGSRPTR
jgi:hypothetical protein